MKAIEKALQKALQKAYCVAKHSMCGDKQVGCVLLDSQLNELSFGYNHIRQPTYAALSTCTMCLYPHSAHNICPAVHAEMHALISLINQNRNSQSFAAVCTLEPCIECAKALALAGVKEIYYDKPTNPRKSGRSIFASLIPSEQRQWQCISKRNTSDTEIPSEDGPTTP